MFAKWTKNDKKAESEMPKMREIVSPHYDDLRGALTVRQVKILKFLHINVDHEPRVLPIRRYVYPDLQMNEAEAHRFDNEFKYRLEYLRALGLVSRVGTSEYALTNLGSAFLLEAKDRGYPGVIL